MKFHETEVPYGSNLEPGVDKWSHTIMAGYQSYRPANRSAMNKDGQKFRTTVLFITFLFTIAYLCTDMATNEAA